MVGHWGTVEHFCILLPHQQRNTSRIGYGSFLTRLAMFASEHLMRKNKPEETCKLMKGNFERGRPFKNKTQTATKYDATVIYGFALQFTFLNHSNLYISPILYTITRSPQASFDWGCIFVGYFFPKFNIMHGHVTHN